MKLIAILMVIMLCVSSTAYAVLEPTPNGTPPIVDCLQARKIIIIAGRRGIQLEEMIKAEQDEDIRTVMMSEAMGVWIAGNRAIGWWTENCKTT